MIYWQGKAHPGGRSSSAAVRAALYTSLIIYLIRGIPLPYVDKERVWRAAEGAVEPDCTLEVNRSTRLPPRGVGGHQLSCRLLQLLHLFRGTLEITRASFLFKATYIL